MICKIVAPIIMYVNVLQGQKKIKNYAKIKNLLEMM